MRSTRRGAQPCCPGRSARRRRRPRSRSTVAGLSPVHHAERRLLPHRHRARRRRRSTPAPGSLACHGLVDRPFALTLRRAAGARQRRGDDHPAVRVQRGRRQPRRQRRVAGRAARGAARTGRRAGRRHADRRPLRRRLHGRVPDRAGDRRPRRPGRLRDERRAAAGRARLPGPARRRRPLRLRVGDEVARPRSSSRRGRTSTATGSRAAGRRKGRSRRRRASTCRASATRRSRAAGDRRRGVGARPRASPRVEVQIDDGDVAGVPSSATSPATTRGCSGVLAWDATPGDHVLRVRATDGDGDTQTDEIARRHPTAPPAGRAGTCASADRQQEEKP